MSLSRKLIQKLQIKVRDIEDEKRELLSAIEDFVTKDLIKSHDLEFKLVPASFPGDKSALNPASSNGEKYVLNPASFSGDKSAFNPTSCSGDKPALNPVSFNGNKSAFNPASCTGDKSALKQTTKTEQPSPVQIDIEEPLSHHGIVSPTKVKVNETLAYDRAKLLEFQFCSVAMRKPEGLPDSVIILDVPIINAQRRIHSTKPEFPVALFKVAPTRKTLDKEKRKKETENPGLQHS